TATTTSLVSSLNPSMSAQAVTFTATVTSAGGTPTGTVTFLDGKIVLGRGTLNAGIATFTTSTLAVGTHRITGSYGGSCTFAPSTSTALTQTVTSATVGISLASRGVSRQQALVFSPLQAITLLVTFPACSSLPDLERRLSDSPAIANKFDATVPS